MSISYSVAHLSDRELLHQLDSLVAQDRKTTAQLLVHLAEVEDRKLHLAAAFSSMHEYCVQRLHLSDSAAFKRIRCARVGREIPKVLEMIADGRLHLSGLVVLSAELTRENADELLAAATHKTRDKIEKLLANRFPKADVPTSIRPLPTKPAPQALTTQLSPGRVETLEVSTVSPPAPATPASKSKVSPLSPQRYSLQATIGDHTREKLSRAQDRLSHKVPSRDVGTILDLALDALLEKLDKAEFAATSKPRAQKSVPKPGKRHIPRWVKRAVRERDGGQCTYVSADGRRCTKRTHLEYDHVVEFARGGESTVENLRLRCRGHNQLTAEQTYGAGFMHQKRTAGQERRSPSPCQPG